MCPRTCGDPLHSLLTEHPPRKGPETVPTPQRLPAWQTDGQTDLQMHDDKGDWEGDRVGAEDHRQMYEPRGRGT